MILATLAHDAMNALICRTVRVRVRRPMAFGHRRDPSAPLSCDRRRRPGPIRCRPWVSSSLSVVYAGTSGSSLGTTVSCGSTSTDCSSGLAPFTTRLADQLAAADAPQAVCGPLLGGALVAHAVATALDVGLYVAALVAPAFGAKGLYRTRYRVPDAVRDRLEGRTVAVVDDVVNAGSAARATIAELRAAGATVLAIGAGSCSPTPPSWRAASGRRRTARSAPLAPRSRTRAATRRPVRPAPDGAESSPRGDLGGSAALHTPPDRGPPVLRVAEHGRSRLGRSLIGTRSAMHRLDQSEQSTATARAAPSSKGFPARTCPTDAWGTSSACTPTHSSGAADTAGPSSKSSRAGSGTGASHA